jgi:hypothetical protein
LTYYNAAADEICRSGDSDAIIIVLIPGFASGG